MPPQGRSCQESRSCLSDKDMPETPSVSIHTSSACQYDSLSRTVSGDMRDGHQVWAWSRYWDVFWEVPRPHSESLASEILAESGTRYSRDNRLTSGQEALQGHSISLPTSLHHGTGTDAVAAKSARAYGTPSTVEKAPNRGRASEPSIRLKDSMSTATRDTRYSLPRSWGLGAARHHLPFVFATSFGPRFDGPNTPDRADKGQIGRCEPDILIELESQMVGGTMSHAQDPSVLP